jgi:tartrate-resistant acid phosphatase type 5
MSRLRLRRIVVAVLVAMTLLVGGCSGRQGAGGSTDNVATSSPSSASTSSAVASRGAEPTTAALVFAAIGDFGTNNRHEADVAALVASWHPTLVIALGDDYYDSAGGTGTGKYARSVGTYYGRWYRAGRFFPALGNHDYSDATPSPETYLHYFALPGPGLTSTSGNERYYDFVEGPVHFFVVNSNAEEPDGITAVSKQGQWLRQALAASTSAWNVVYDHHPPYSSDRVHGSTVELQWPYRQWGADVVLSGHAHDYERILNDGMTYFVNGLGGAARYAFAESPVSGSVIRYDAEWGAQRVTATDTALTFAFYDTRGDLIDSYTLRR